MNETSCPYGILTEVTAVDIGTHVTWINRHYGWMDEVRVSAGALAPTSFLTLRSGLGMMLMLR